MSSWRHNRRIRPRFLRFAVVIPVRHLPSVSCWRGKPEVHGQVQQSTSHNTASALPRLRTTYDPRRTSNKLSVARTVGVLDSRLLWAENTPTRPHAPRAFPTTVDYVNSPSTASSWS